MASKEPASEEPASEEPQASRPFFSLVKYKGELNRARFIFSRVCKPGMAVVLYKASNKADIEAEGASLKPLDNTHPGNKIPEGHSANQFCHDIDCLPFVETQLTLFESCGALNPDSYHIIKREKNFLIIFNRNQYGKHPVNLINKIRAILNGYEYEEGKFVKLVWAKNRPRNQVAPEATE